MRPKDLIKGAKYTNGTSVFSYWGLLPSSKDKVTNGTCTYYVFFDARNECHELRLKELNNLIKV